MARNLISILDVEKELQSILDLAVEIKSDWKKDKGNTPLKGQVLGMIFEKPSLRTRISFEVGMYQLGGSAIYISPNEIKMGKRESVYDVAKVISRYVSGVMYRAYDHNIMAELGQYAEVPVINGLDDIEHPCQIISDLLTIMEHKGKLEGLKLAWVGDGNNVCNSLLLGTAVTGMSMTAACPRGFEPNEKVLAQAQERSSKILVTDDPKKAALDADVIYTDTWVSMGEESERREKVMALQDFQVNEKLVSMAKDDAIVMHCLPAHRGEEITDEVMDGPHSVVFDQAENRMHAQKGIMTFFMKKD